MARSGIDPDRILTNVLTVPGIEFEHTDGMTFSILEHENGRRAVSFDNTFSRIDHSIEWRVEGTEGVGKDTVG